MATFTLEQLNFFKFSTVVIDEFPVALRKVFVYMWDTNVAPKHGGQKWDNSSLVLNLFLSKEGGVKKVPTLNKSYEEWDCTALFKATLFSQTFAMPDGSGILTTLDKLYVKPHGLLSGAFHTSVISPAKNKAETFAMALDQLRLLRNTLCHQTCTRKIDKATFDRYVQLAKDAFAALGQDSTRIDDIGKLAVDDFPTARVQQLEDELRKEKDAAIKFSQIENHLNQIGSDTKDVKAGVTIIETKIDVVSSCMKEIKANQDDWKQAKQAESLKGHLVPISCIPPKIPHFFGRQEECRAVLDHLVNEDTRLVNICGPPGFGKTSVAINVAHQLQERKIPVYFVSLRGMKSKGELISRLLSIFSDASQLPDISPSHWLIHCLQQLKSPLVLILDNADDLLETEDAGMKEEVLKFTDEILAQCGHCKLLFTTRESLGYLNHKLSMHAHKISVLDEVSSSNLVESLLPDVTEESCCSILKECGQVPLAMRLMCSILSEENISVNELKQELEASPLVKVLDDESFPDDVRLSIIINTSFQRLRGVEKDTFVSLAVFPGWFGIKEATEVLALEQVRPSKVIRSLEQKSLIDCRDGYFTIHSLLRSFIDEKRTTDKELGAVFQRAQHRFYNQHIASFEAANETFLTGQSVEAVHAFYGQRENILFSLENGAKDDELYPKVVEALSKAELFLYAVLLNEGSLFETLYDTVVKEAKKRQNLVDEKRLLAAKSFAHWGWFHEHQTWDNSLQGKSTNTSGWSAKLLCYYGIYQLLCGNAIQGYLSIIECSLDRLGSHYDEKVLHELASQVLVKARLKSFMHDLQEQDDSLLKLGETLGVAGDLFYTENFERSFDLNPFIMAFFPWTTSNVTRIGLALKSVAASIDENIERKFESASSRELKSANQAKLTDDIIFLCIRMRLLNYVNSEERFLQLDKLYTTGTGSEKSSQSQEIANFLKECSKAFQMMSFVLSNLNVNACSEIVVNSGSLSRLADIIDQLSPDSCYPLLICNETLLQMEYFLELISNPDIVKDESYSSLKKEIAFLRSQLQTILK